MPSTPSAAGSSSSPNIFLTASSSLESLMEESTFPTWPGRSTRTTSKPHSTIAFLTSTCKVLWSAMAPLTGATMCGPPSPPPSRISRLLNRTCLTTGRPRVALPTSTTCVPPPRLQSASLWPPAWSSSQARLNWYDLYRHNYDLPASSNADRLGTTVIDGETRTYKRGMTQAEYTPFASHIVNSESANVVNGDFLTDYMNRQDVREALNIPSSVQTW